ncbi:hypothetical protein ZIOFF_034209 [Zingiber officinale]|uniref:Uncharacterized protein n=1 Tax=Zingiber officinale TaxID=94328 RepID=A0A8J5GKR9_ZINOF|nr:hypothetical protein ZIOFF_034209 [Zingiber officinale]
MPRGGSELKGGGCLHGQRDLTIRLTQCPNSIRVNNGIFSNRQGNHQCQHTPHTTPKVAPQQDPTRGQARSSPRLSLFSQEVKPVQAALGKANTNVNTPSGGSDLKGGGLKLGPSSGTAFELFRTIFSSAFTVEVIVPMAWLALLMNPVRLYLLLGECMLLMISVPFVVVVWGSGKIAGLCQAFNDILDDLTMYLWLLNLAMGLINNGLSGVMVSLMRVQVTCKTSQSQVSLDEGLGDRHRLAKACVIGYGLGVVVGGLMRSVGIVRLRSDNAGEGEAMG